jgi:hypothetical protein
MMAGLMHPLRSAAGFSVYAGLLLVCIWPAIYNGQPFINPDTLQYIRYADAGVAKIMGHSADWVQLAPRYHAEATSNGTAGSNGDAPRHAPLAGRSIYYGALLRLGDVFGLMWPSIMLQAAALMLAIALTLHHTIGFRRANFAATVAVLAFTTPMAFYVSKLMPDIFAGIAILGAANLIVFGDRMNRLFLLTWICLLCAALSFHSSHVLVAVYLLAIYLVIRFFSHGAASLRGLAGIICCILFAFAADATFTMATTRMFGEPPIRPPFLAARVAVDGPGTAYLKAHCPEAGFTLCRFVDRLPVVSTDTFLWSPDPAEGGVFAPSDPATQRGLSDEQFRFVLAVLMADPVGETAAMLKDSILQISKVSLLYYNYDQQMRDAFRAQMPSRYVAAEERTKAWNGTLPVLLISVIVIATALASLAYLVHALVWFDRDSFGEQDLRRFSVVVIVGTLANGFVCGAMSEPDERYQARLMWLIPLVAGLIYQRRFLNLQTPPASARGEASES